MDTSIRSAAAFSLLGVAAPLWAADGLNHSLASAMLVGAVATSRCDCSSTDLSEEHVAVVQAELGLTAIAVTLSDFSVAQIATMRQVIRQSAHAPLFLAARAGAAEVERQLSAFKEMTEPLTAEQNAQKQQLTTSLAAMRATATSERAQLTAEVRAAVESPAWQVFDRVRAAPASLPPAMRVLEANAEELRALAAAVFEERKNAADPSRVSQQDRDRLASARVNGLVAAASQRLAVRLGEVSLALRGQAN